MTANPRLIISNSKFSGAWGINDGKFINCIFPADTDDSKLIIVDNAKLQFEDCVIGNNLSVTTISMLNGVEIHATGGIINARSWVIIETDPDRVRVELHNVNIDLDHMMWSIPSTILFSTGDYVAFEPNNYPPFSEHDSHELLKQIMTYTPDKLIGEREIYILEAPITEVTGKIYNDIQSALDYLDITFSAPIVPPPATLRIPMAYDSSRNKCVIFGGANSTGYSISPPKTWEWDGLRTRWTEISTSTVPNAPGGVENFGMCYDSNRNVTVLFGGFGGSGTWEYNGTNWALITTAASPSARQGHSMSFDSVRNVTILFGGSVDGTETWEYNGTNWSLITTAHYPSSRMSFGMCYDSDRDVTVLYGGYPGGRDTWEYNGTDWTQMSPPIAPPYDRTGHRLIYDTKRSKTVLYGGNTIEGETTWEYNGTTWTQVLTAHHPVNYFNHGMAYDSLRDVTVVFGGESGGTPSTTTWEYNGTDWVERVGNPLTVTTSWSVRVFSTNEEASLISIPDWVTIVGDGNTYLKGAFESLVTNHTTPFYNVRGCRIEDLTLNSGKYLSLKDCIIEASHLVSGVAGLTFDNCTLDGNGAVNLDLSTATSVTLSGCKLGNMTLGNSIINNCETIAGKTLTIDSPVTVTANNSKFEDLTIPSGSTLDIRNSVVDGDLTAATGSTLKKYNTQVIGDETIEDGVDEENGDAETALAMAMITLTGN